LPGWGAVDTLPAVFCNQCGHRNPPGSNFCSSCGAVLNLTSGDDTTMTIVLNQAEDREGDEDLAVSLEDLGEGTAMLVVRKGPNEGSKYLLDAEVTRAGRHPDSDIFLDDITVSRRHAELVRAGASYRLRDTGSLNGTYLNRERIDEAVLKAGDEVQIGKYRLVYVAASDGE
jgi:pSer/pThr/pTyr-binding forkhead associated (FHA) protein